MIEENYKEALIKWVKEKTRSREIGYVIPIMERIVFSSNTLRKEVEALRNEEKEEKIGEKIIEICEDIVRKNINEGYNALGIPTIIGFNRAPNFYIKKEKPTEEEIWWWLYHILSGIHNNDVIINLLNVKHTVREGFRNYLKSEEFILIGNGSGLNVKKISSELKIKGIHDKPFIFAILVLSFFVFYWKKHTKKIDVNSREELLRDDSSLLVLTLSKKEKKKVFIFPKISKIINEWYSDVIEGKESIPSLLKFIFSLTILDDKKYKKLSTEYLNKLCYYILKGKVSGEILSKSIELKVEYELKNLKDRKKVNGVSRGEFFFSKLE
jgi:hypothetical protein